MDKLRSDCIKLQCQKEQLEDEEKYKQNAISKLCEHEEFLLLEQQKKQQSDYVKSIEREHMNQAEDEYRNHIKNLLVATKSAKKQTAAELRGQMRVPVAQSARKGEPCPHGKIYYCAFCAKR